MPIDLTQLTKGARRNRPIGMTPKYFSSKLTGIGQKTGLLNENVHPTSVPTNQPSDTGTINSIERKSRQLNNDVETALVPLAPLRHTTLAVPGVTMTIPATSKMHELGKDRHGRTCWLHLTTQGLSLREDRTIKPMVRELVIQYRCEVFAIGDQSDPRAIVSQPASSKTNSVHLQWSKNVPASIVQMIQTATGISADPQAIDDYLMNYEVANAISELAEAWNSDKIGELVVTLISDYGRLYLSNPATNLVEQLSYQLRYLENYGVSLTAYKLIYDAIAANFPADVATALNKQNMNLLMTSTLHELEALKPQLNTIPPLKAGAQLDAKLSGQQRIAVTTREPLFMTAAGAGTGKSTTIRKRLDHMVECGARPEGITVLSFTNAAADNILSTHPNTRSMTIAAMINQIYQLNFPGHELSTIETLSNTLDIYFPNKDASHQLQIRLMAVKNNKPGAYTTLNNFVENNFDEVLMMLGTVGQTTLELEQIIAYHKIDTLQEPVGMAPEHVIIDEVQDNSIFEFIYLLRYVTKHKASLFIVGDPSQTLYEFRNANPKALNALEASGVFVTHQLTTNYRSNQEILDFANIHLNDIEANQYARIQLQANSLKPVTSVSYQHAVTVDYRDYARLAGFDADLYGIMHNTIREWIDECLQAGQSVAILAHKRREVALLGEMIGEMYPGRTISNLVPDLAYDSTYFSSYIKQFWNDICQVPPKNAPALVHKEMLKNIAQIGGGANDKTRERNEKKLAEALSAWWISVAAAVTSWVGMVNAGIMTNDAFFDQLRNSLLDYEIRNNSIRQSVVRQRNEARKEKNLNQNADFFLSTVHSAKGLEFDNVLMLHQYENQMDEDKKRMYYVAITRAQHRLYVLSRGTLKNAAILGDHQLYIKALQDQEAAAADSDPDDEVTVVYVEDDDVDPDELGAEPVS